MSLQVSSKFSDQLRSAFTVTTKSTGDDTQLTGLSKRAYCKHGLFFPIYRNNYFFMFNGRSPTWHHCPMEFRSY